MYLSRYLLAIGASSFSLLHSVVKSLMFCLASCMAIKQRNRTAMFATVLTAIEARFA